MLSISCEGVAEGLRSPPGSAADAKVAFRAAERAMAAALRIHRRVRDLLDVAPEVDMDGVEATTSRVAGQVGTACCVRRPPPSLGAKPSGDTGSTDRKRSVRSDAQPLGQKPECEGFSRIQGPELW